MIFHFDTAFDRTVYAQAVKDNTIQRFGGPLQLLQLLEKQLGSAGYPENTSYLQIEFYRQALQQYATTAKTAPFYAASFEADRLATAQALLEWRNQLAAGGWDFAISSTTPERLAVFGAVEAIYRRKMSDLSIAIQAKSQVDRWNDVLTALADGATKNLPDEIRLYEAESLQPPIIQRFLAIAQKNGCRLVLNSLKNAPENPITDLEKLQYRLHTGANLKEKGAKNDGSLLILRTKRESEMAAAVASLLKNNAYLQPVILIPDQARALETALVNEGLPALGLHSNSLARPALQLLKLAPAFLWEPVDIYKIMEFVTLPLKPIDDGLAMVIARVLAEKPGLKSDMWFAAVYSYLEMESTAPAAKRDYAFWFDRKRYKITESAPKNEALSLFHYIRDWVLNDPDKLLSKHRTLLVLADQAHKIIEVLDALPESRITFLELERIIRTVYQPSPVQLEESECGHLKAVHPVGGFADRADTVLWWNCHYRAVTPVSDWWDAAEYQYLQEKSVILYSAAQESALNRSLRMRPIFCCENQLILCIPDQADGKEMVPDLLLGDIEAVFPNLQEFTYHLDKNADLERLNQRLSAPMRARLDSKHKPKLPILLSIENTALIPDAEYETLTNLEQLFYYPHRWFFKNKLRLSSAGLLTISRENTLLGNLAHRFFELLLKMPFYTWDKAQTDQWIVENAPSLLEKEGATLLLYGREPEKQVFLKKIKLAAWNLISMIKSNGWTVLATEYELEGFFCGIPVRSKADLILKRCDEQAVIDLKWSGLRHRKEVIQNEEDLQLIFYAYLLPPADQWAHTAYFIIQEGKMVARNAHAFKEAMLPGAEQSHEAVNSRIFEKMEKTYRWRMEQIRKGLVELRKEAHLTALEELYAGQMMDFLEMKSSESKYDDFKALLR